MGSPIYLPPDKSPLDGIGDVLLKSLMAKQQMDTQKESLKLRQQELKVQQEERDAAKQAAAEAAQAKQAEQAYLLSQLMGPARQIIGQAFGAAQGGGVPGRSPMPQMSPVQQQFTQFAGQNPQVASMAAPAAFKVFEAEQKQLADARAFDDGLKIAQNAGLLDSSEIAGLAAYRRLSGGGTSASPELKALIPMTAIEKVELAKKAHELNEAKTAEDADRIATEYAVSRGWLQPGGTVKGAAKMVFDEQSKVRSEARSRSLELEKIQLANMEKVLESKALEAVLEVGTEPGAIAAAIKAKYPKLEGGLAMKAAVSASKQFAEMKKAGMPGDTQAKHMLVYLPARAAEANVMEAVKAGAKWGGVHDEAVADYKFGVDVPLVGDLLRYAARKRMSPEQQKLFVAAILLTDARVRPISGAQVSAGEVRATVNAFIPQTSDATPESSAQKLAALRDYMTTLRQTAGVDADTPATSAAEMLLEMQRGETKVPNAPPSRERDIRDQMNRTGASYNEAARIVDARKRQSVPRNQ